MNRKKFLINPKFQLSIIFWMMGLSALVLVITYSANLFFFRNYLEKGKAVGLPKDHVFFEFLAEQFRTMNWIFFGLSVLIFGTIFVVGLVLSHRVAGPLHRLHEHMKSINPEGTEIRDVQFRDKDYFLEIAESYNGILNTLRVLKEKK